MLPCGAVTAFAALRGRKRIDHTKLRLHHGHDDQLRQPLHRLQRESYIAAVPRADHELALVIAVNQAHQVTQHDAMFVAQA